MKVADTATTEKEAERLRASAIEKFTAAHASEQTFVSLYNLWDASGAIGLTDQAARLLKEL